MSYSLPKFQDTFLVTRPTGVDPYELYNEQIFHIAKFYRAGGHKEIWRRHRNTVLRYRRLQRLWRRGGKYFAFIRARILFALEAG